MTMNLKDVPLPRDPRHQRFADLILQDYSITEAYLNCGFKAVSRKAAASSGNKLRKRKDVVAYIQAIQMKAAEGEVLSLKEKREYLARVVRSSIHELEEEKNGDLIKSLSESTSELSSSRRLEKVDPLKAIEIDTKIAGEDPHANAIEQLAKEIGKLGTNNPLPAGKL